MGFRFRRSVKILPGIRLNLSGSGASVSLGPRGFHYTVGPKGTRVTAGIPGTGLSFTDYQPHARPIPRSDRLSRPREVDSYEPAYRPSDYLAPIESGPVKEINAFSTSELAPFLNDAHRKLRVAPLIQLVSILLFVAALLSGNQLWLGLSALYATALVPCSIFLDRYRRSVKIVYELHGAAGKISDALAESFRDVLECQAIWRINSEGRTFDWKRNAGATSLNTRKKIKFQFDKPLCIRGKLTFPALKLGQEEIYLLPDAALLVSNNAVAAINYQDFELSNSRVKYIEEEPVPSDSPVVDHTWRYVNKKGGPDRRFNSNKQLPICVYGELSFWSEGGLNCKVHCSNPVAADRLCSVIEVLHSSTLEIPRQIASIKTASRWPLAALLISAAFFAALQIAVFVKLPPPLGTFQNIVFPAQSAPRR